MSTELLDTFLLGSKLCSWFFSLMVDGLVTQVAYVLKYVQCRYELGKFLKLQDSRWKKSMTRYKPVLFPSKCIRCFTVLYLEHIISIYLIRIFNAYWYKIPCHKCIIYLIAVMFIIITRFNQTAYINQWNVNVKNKSEPKVRIFLTFRPWMWMEHAYPLPYQSPSYGADFAMCLQFKCITEWFGKFLFIRIDQASRQDLIGEPYEFFHLYNLHII